MARELSTDLVQGWQRGPQIAPANCLVDSCQISLSALRSDEGPKPVQALVFGNRRALPRYRPCLSLYERIPAGSAEGYERRDLAHVRSVGQSAVRSTFCSCRLPSPTL